MKVASLLDSTLHPGVFVGLLILVFCTISIAGFIDVRDSNRRVDAVLGSSITIHGVTYFVSNNIPGSPVMVECYDIDGKKISLSVSAVENLLKKKIEQ